MNGCVHRRECPERLPDGRHPRNSDAHDVAKGTLAMFGRFTWRVALYILPGGEVLRVSNPLLLDDDITDSFVGVYDDQASESEIVEDILAIAE